MKELKWFNIINVSGNGIFQDDNIVQAYNTKEALEKHLGLKVKYLKSDSDLRWAKKVWSVIEGDDSGRIYGDRRKRKFYTLAE
jgi:hypothetical protein